MKTLDEHNADVKAAIELQRKSGVACPRCGKEMKYGRYDDDRGDGRRVYCNGCKYSGVKL